MCHGTTQLTGHPLPAAGSSVQRTPRPTRVTSNVKSTVHIALRVTSGEANRAAPERLTYLLHILEKAVPVPSDRLLGVLEEAGERVVLRVQAASPRASVNGSAATKCLATNRTILLQPH